MKGAKGVLCGLMSRDVQKGFYFHCSTSMETSICTQIFMLKERI